ncbi:DMT family transporter [Clostridium ihumii]|uniref:DMT family transporter n=1 Tax=Clostridium ihumii TaxID=1470356 RepID=UPI000556D6B4|nr:DMT family transporter [Clostridium ihumii]
MIAIIIAIISGVSMSLQGVFNTKLSEKLGLWETNVVSQAIALIVTLIVMIFAGKGDLKAIKDVNKFYLLSGVLGAVIIYTVMKSISSLGTSCGIGIILIAQLGAAAIIDSFGLFGTEKTPYGIKEMLGIGIMIAGIIIFKWKK